MTPIRYFVVLSVLFGCSQHAQAQPTRTCYDASAGTLPESQGWDYIDNWAATNAPAPYVVDGVLNAPFLQGNSNIVWGKEGARIWSRFDNNLNFSQKVTLEAQVSIADTLQRGFTLGVVDDAGRTVSIALSADSIAVSPTASVPFPVIGTAFHVYRIEAQGNIGRIYVDGALLAENIVPAMTSSSVRPKRVFIQGASGDFSSDSQLTYACFGVTPNFLTIPIDVKPQTLRNSINTQSEGFIPVALLSTTTFAATERIALDSLRFGATGHEESLGFCNANGEDVNQDGLLDLLCHFKTAATGLAQQHTSATLRASTLDGLLVERTDSVRVVR